jgi:hypothetical protein
MHPAHHVAASAAWPNPPIILVIGGTIEAQFSITWRSIMDTRSAVLADRRWFLIGDAQWEEFQRLLEQPARDLPRLRALLAKPSPIADIEQAAE